MEKPVIYSAAGHPLDEIKSTHRVIKVIDSYHEQLKELFLIRNPRFRFSHEYQKELDEFTSEHSKGDLSKCGNWVFFPWSGDLVHYLADKEHQEIRTARNKNLITKEEQEKFYNCTIGVAGLSVGSHGALTIAMMGGSRTIKLADPDILGPANLNRMRFDFTQIGVNKSELVARYIYQLNPYADIHVFVEGITEKNKEEFLDGLDILIEELDDITMKFKMREGAKKRKLPVVMVTDNADSVIIDVERFDLHPDLIPFNGALEGMDIEEIKKSPAKMFEAMGKIIDLSYVPTRMLHSVLEVGKTIYSWPQLATAATLSGVALAYIARRIALGEKVKEGKSEINLRFLNPDYDIEEEERKRELERFLKTFTKF